jgi:hypothetical protein
MEMKKTVLGKHEDFQPGLDPCKMTEPSIVISHIKQYGRIHWNFIPHLGTITGARRGQWKAFFKSMADDNVTLDQYLDWLTKFKRPRASAPVGRLFSAGSSEYQRFVQEATRVWGAEEEPVRRVMAAYMSRWPSENKDGLIATMEDILQKLFVQGVKEELLLECIGKFSGPNPAPWLVFKVGHKTEETYRQKMNRIRDDAQKHHIKDRVKYLKAYGPLVYLEKCVYEPLEGHFKFVDVYLATYGKPFSLEVIPEEKRDWVRGILDGSIETPGQVRFWAKHKRPTTVKS